MIIGAPPDDDGTLIGCFSFLPYSCLLISFSQVEIFAEIGEVMAGRKTLPKIPDCGKKFLLFKSLGEVAPLLSSTIE